MRISLYLVKSVLLLMLCIFFQYMMQQQQSTHNISVTWRGMKFILEMNSAATLKDLGYELQKLTDVKADTMRLIVPQASDRSSRLLSPFSDEHSHLSLQETSFFEVTFFTFILCWIDNLPL
ncbi:hypothetical protein CsSME_00026933 [Camellia sinensis var. sinensis]